MGSIYPTLNDGIPSESMTNHSIVLDIDETLVHTMDDHSILNQLGILTNPHLMDLRKRTYKLLLEDVLTKRGA